MPEDSSPEALDRLQRLNQLSLEILDALEQERFARVLALMKRRQESIEALGDLDAFRPGLGSASRAALPENLASELKRLIALGEQLSAQVERKMQLFDQRRRQNLVTVRPPRGYRPRPRPPIGPRAGKA